MSGNYEQRNAQLINDRNNGMSYRDLAKKYGITRARASQIYERYKANQLLRNDPLYASLLNSCWKLGYDTGCAKRAYNALHRCKIKTLRELKLFIKHGDTDVGEIRNIGAKSKRLILHSAGIREEA